MSRLRSYRKAANLTQTELAELAGVSRQLIGSVEAGRHLPRVDAALALADALEVDVAALFLSPNSPRDAISGETPADGSAVRVGRVGDTTVTAPARLGWDGWDVADGIVEDGAINSLGSRHRGFVVAGCEPGLGVVERLLREKGLGAVSAMASSKTAVEALRAGRVHAAVVHGPALEASPADCGVDVDRVRLARWQVGLSGPPDAVGDWWDDALRGRVAVAQRESGAGVQATFEAAVNVPGRIQGPRVDNHVQAAVRSVVAGLAAVTIEPAARATGAAFHPLAVHQAELWVAREWADESAVMEALNVINSRRFQARLAAVGGYDLTGCGSRVA